MKRTYELAEMEVVHFEAEDIITTSLYNGGDGGSSDAVNKKPFQEMFPGLVDNH